MLVLAITLTLTKKFFYAFVESLIQLIIKFKTLYFI